jgi:hypothetical protein
MEILSVILAAFLGYFFGLNAGYRMPRDDEKEEGKIVNVEVLNDDGTLLAYDLFTKKFLMQAPDVETLVEMLKEKFPNETIVLSRTQEL